MKLTNLKQQGEITLDCVKKNGTLVRLNYGDVINSKDLNEEQFNKSLKGGQIKVYLEAGWFVEGAKSVKGKIIGAPAAMNIVNEEGQTITDEKLEDTSMTIINEGDAVADTSTPTPPTAEENKENKEEGSKEIEEPKTEGSSEENKEEGSEENKETDPFL